MLTLLIVATVMVQLVQRREVDLLWTETLMIALAHYFTSRRFIKLSPEVIERLAAEGYVETEVHPLYLPRLSIRALLVLAFVGLAVYLYRNGHLMDPQAVSILGVVFAYFLGLVVRFKNVPGLEDLKAAVVLALLAFVAGAYFLQRADLVPHVLQNVTLALVLFYFGSR